MAKSPASVNGPIAVTLPAGAFRSPRNAFDNFLSAAKVQRDYIQSLRGNTDIQNVPHLNAAYAACSFYADKARELFAQRHVDSLVSVHN